MRASPCARATAKDWSGCAATARVQRSAWSACAILADGRVAYLLRKPRRNGATHLVMMPMQFLARLAALIPPPRFP